MTVLVTLRVAGDSAKLEAYAKEHQDDLTGLAERGREKGATHHTFYGSDSEVLVVDEWPDEQTFQEFFEEEQDTISPMMEIADSDQPEITFWRKLDTGDEF
jgi:hypothetical protein